MQYHDVTPYPIWRTAAILKMVLSLYISRRSSDFDDIFGWCGDPNVGFKNGNVTICKFSGGRRS